MRYIDNHDLRQWVQESLQRKLVQQAHELAVQTGCEVLLRVQDGGDSPHSKYYVTGGLVQEYVTHGVKLGPGDQLMSGETGLPTSSSPDPQEQRPAETDEPRENTPDRHAANLPVGGDLLRGVRTPDPVNPVYVHRTVPPEALVQMQSAVETLQGQANQQTELERQWRSYGSLKSYVRRTNAPQGTSFPHRGQSYQEKDSASQGLLQSRDNALIYLQRMHLNNFAEHMTEPHELVPAGSQEVIVSAPQREETTSVSSDARGNMDDMISLKATYSSPPNSYRNTSPQETRESPSKHLETPFMNNGTQGYLCHICHHTFTDIYNLINHAKMLHSNLEQLVFVCNCCQRPFENARSLHHHLETVGPGGFTAGAACALRGVEKPHARTRRLSCPLCGKTFSRFGFMQSHIERIHGGHQLRQEMIPTPETSGVGQDATSPVLATASDNNENGRVSSENVPENFARENIHAAAAGGEQDKLKSSSPSSSELLPPDDRMAASYQGPVSSNSEDRLSFREEIFECQECSKTFSHSRYLKEHVNNCHIQGMPQFHNHQTHFNGNRGTGLPYSTGSSQEISNNNRNEPVSHHTDTALVCVKQEVADHVLDLRVPSESSEVTSSLQEDPVMVVGGHNIKTPSSEGGEGAISFDAMNSVTPDQEDTGQPGGTCRNRRYACDVCGKTYKYSFHMKEHRLTHAAVSPFTCRLCGMGFFRQRQMRDHELRHTGMYPCRCDLCGKGFPRTSELKRHRAFRHRRLTLEQTNNSR